MARSSGLQRWAREARRHRGIHHGRYVAAEFGDLAHQRAADALQLGLRQQQHGFHRGQQLAVHGRHLRF
eukprot:630-Eustigmatos_ZCMA.PRE.1